ncbi:hypothetical protein KIH39_21855 [Telmatocola sphagniphila]|uniref:Peptidase M56 domain-containing protein n=1 Tax=Telmatocola sphagniphila TaxID=1123043 RepID=A0A8E6EUI9_9BACT|nr:M56 family metallopeptidase [Telmatocola sphagniphila]QVL31465.1 hypothetical protein KIH39_21855 [Telmatocola sphagniphila]
MNSLIELQLRNALAASLLAVIVWGVCRFVKRPAVQHTLWMLVLLRLFMPPIWAVELPHWPTREPEVLAKVKPPEIPVEKPVQNTEPDPRDLIEPNLAANTNIPTLPETAFDQQESILPDVTAATSVPQVAEEKPALVLAEPQESTPRISFTLWDQILTIWLAGFLILLTLGLYRVLQFQRLLRLAEPADGDLHARLDRLAAQLRLRNTPPILMVAGTLPPMLWQGKIIFPRQLKALLSPAECDAVLLHELAHLSRGDGWVRYLEWTASLVYWWFPLVRFIRKQLRAAEELSCDEVVIARLPERKAYATALVETAGFLNGPCLAVPQLASGAGPVLSLQRRIVMIMQSNNRRRSRTAWLFSLALGVGGLTLSPIYAQQPAPAAPSGIPATRAEAPSDPRAKEQSTEDRIRETDNRIRDLQRQLAEEQRKLAQERAQKPKGTPEEIEKARKELTEIQTTLREMNQKMIKAMNHLMELEGRSGAAGGFAFGGGTAGGGGFGGSFGGFRGPGDGGFGGPGGGFGGLGGGGGGGGGGFGGGAIGGRNTGGSTGPTPPAPPAATTPAPGGRLGGPGGPPGMTGPGASGAPSMGGPGGFAGPGAPSADANPDAFGQPSSTRRASSPENARVQSELAQMKKEMSDLRNMMMEMREMLKAKKP